MNLRALSVALAAAATVLAAPADASIVSMHTRHSAAGAPNLGSDAANGAYYRDLLAGLIAGAPTAGFCDASPAAYAGLSNQATCGGAAGSIAFAFVVDFDTTAVQGADFNLRVGPDFGRGGALFLDGSLLAVNTNDMWWNGSFGQASQIFQAFGLSIGAGPHELAVYGLEGCCDGLQRAEFSLGRTGAWSVFSATDALQPVRVPEPGYPALLVTALAALALVRRTRQR